MAGRAENAIAAIIVDAAFKIHSELGRGLLESVYETILEFELTRRGLEVKRQWPIPVIYGGHKLEDGFRADLIINDLVIIEIKSLDLIPPIAYKILLTYLRLSGMRLGLMINFREELIRDGIKRVVNGLQ